MRAIFLTLVCALLCAPACSLARPPLWIAHGARSTVVLFGSVHLLPAGLDWEPQRLAEALSRADQVWFELPLDAATQMETERAAIARGSLPAGERLSDLLTTDQQARLARVAATLGVALDRLQILRPWLAEMTLSLAADERTGAMASQGVERRIGALAPASARREALETADQQINFLAGAAAPDQIASLDETLQEIEERPAAYSQEVAEWMAGDLAGLTAEALEPLRKAAPAIYDRLITQRNRRWAGAVNRRLDQPGVTVVIVGMGHLLGPGGVPALLRDRGIRVDGP